MGKVNIILPDFIIIGANKAATTSVANYLSQHPEIKISSVKEPMFFSSNPGVVSSRKESATLERPYFSCTLPEYSALFENHKATASVFGEASTSYLANPWMSSRLIKKLVPNMRIMAILREPASRALSAYKMCYGNGMEKRSFQEIVQGAVEQTVVLRAHGVKEYIRIGLYSQLLRPYVNFFETSQLLFLKYDDLVQDTNAFMDRILSFIGASPYRFQTNVRFNTAQDNLKKQLAINKEDIETLRRFYQDDIDKTEQLTGLDLNSWKIPPM